MFKVKNTRVTSLTGTDVDIPVILWLILSAFWLNEPVFQLGSRGSKIELTHVLPLYPLKTSESLLFTKVLSGYRRGIFGWNWVTQSWQYQENCISRLNRSSHQRCSIKKLFLKISKNLQENVFRSLFFNKIAGLMPAPTLLKRRLWNRCFPVKFAKFLRTTLLQNNFGCLFLAEHKTAAIDVKFSANSEKQISYFWD